MAISNPTPICTGLTGTIGEPHGSGLGTVRCVVEHANAWLFANRRFDRCNNRLTIIIDALPTAACIFLIANRFAGS